MKETMIGNEIEAETAVEIGEGIDPGLGTTGIGDQEIANHAIEHLGIALRGIAVLRTGALVTKNHAPGVNQGANLGEFVVGLF